ncbi:MAG: hypothetical protein WAM39_09025 [Bryobacteraceae bacterium]
MRADVILFADASLGPLHRDLALPGKSLDPAVVLVGPFAEYVFSYRSRLMKIAEEVDDILRPGK